jgi:hypothetical protein
VFVIDGPNGETIEVLDRGEFSGGAPVLNDVADAFDQVSNLMGQGEQLGSLLSSVFHKATGLKLSTVTPVAAGFIPGVGSIASGLLQAVQAKPGASSPTSSPLPKPAPSAPAPHAAALAGSGVVLLVVGLAAVAFVASRRGRR